MHDVSKCIEDNVRKCIENNKIIEAFKILEEYSEFRDEVTRHRVRYNSLREQKRKGTIRDDAYDVEFNKLISAILEMARNIDSVVNRPEPKKPEPLPSPLPTIPTIPTLIQFEWVNIPGGKFFKGEDERSVYVPEYFIAKVPVTNAQYKRFIDSTGHEAPIHWEKKGLFRISIHIPENKGDHPVVNVTWDDAQAFCKWAGVCLPTETQWEKAARGTDKRHYPWGNQPPNMLICNFNNLKEGTTSVDAHLDGSSPYDCLDMSGNVWEWTDSPYDTEFYLMCGGAFNSNADNLYCTIRNQDTPDKLFNNVGFRVSSPGPVS